MVARALPVPAKADKLCKLMSLNCTYSGLNKVSFYSALCCTLFVQALKKIKSDMTNEGPVPNSA